MFTHLLTIATLLLFHLSPPLPLRNHPVAIRTPLTLALFALAFLFFARAAASSSSSASSRRSHYSAMASADTSFVHTTVSHWDLHCYFDPRSEASLKNMERLRSFISEHWPRVPMYEPVARPIGPHSMAMVRGLVGCLSLCLL